MQERIAIVTGASRGIGRFLVETIHDLVVGRITEREGAAQTKPAVRRLREIEQARREALLLSDAMTLAPLPPILSYPHG